jgi:transcriptional regulator with XRE-family HTH domain
MIGLQEIIINNNIKVSNLAKEIGVSKSTIWGWIRNNHVPNKNLKILSEKLHVEEGYLNKVVNDINTYQPKIKGFNTYEIKGDITEIHLENKKGFKTVTIIDTKNLQKLIDLNYHWYLQWDYWKKSYYAATTIRPFEDKSIGKTLRLNMLLTNSSGNIVADHINRDTLDNRESNLRIVDKSKNATNRDGANINNKTGVRNVHRIKGYKQDSYKVQLMKNGERYVWDFPLDQFEEACQFAEKKRKEIFGKDYAGVGQKLSK